MTEIEKTEGEIKVLQAKLELLKEMENHKSPVEEAYKRFFGRYPNSDDCWTDYNEEIWYFFQVGYKSAKEDCKVGEEVEEDEWKLVALRFGEKLSDTGPGGYYDFTPGEWMEWALNAYEQGTCKVVEEPKPMDDVIDRLVEKYKSQKLWNMLRNELGYSIDCCDEIVDLVEKWLPKEQSAEGSQNTFAIDATEGFNHCLRKMKGMLR
jgi:hypothetical protein